MENIMTVPKKLKMELLYKLTLPLQNISKIIKSRDSNRYLYTDVPSSITNNNQKVQMTQMPMNE